MHATNLLEPTHFRTSIDRLRNAVQTAWRVAPHASGSEWAQRHFRLSAEYAGSNAGRLRLLPYQVEPLDAMVDPRIPEVVFLKSSRVGYTVLLQCAMAYWIGQQPMRILVLQPTDEDAKDFSKENIGPMLRDVPALRGLIADAAKRDNNNTILKKTFPGGMLTVSGASTPTNFRRIGVDKALLDEIDGYPIGDEGNQVKLASQRTVDSPYAKMIMGSTPTEEDVSKIEPAYKASDMRLFDVPCPMCGTYQTIEWERIRWPAGKPHKAALECRECSRSIDEAKKPVMLRDGRWRAQRPEVRHRRGYFIWAGYSTLPGARWGILAREFLEAKDKPEDLQVFMNTTLGQTWKHSVNAVDSNAIKERAEAYPAEVPNGAMILTAGVDTQGDRLEVEVVGWGPGEESWSIGYYVLWGDPNLRDVWDQLDELLFKKTWQHESGASIGVSETCIDAMGHHTDMVYSYAEERRNLRVWACKGQAGPRGYVQMPGQDRRQRQRAQRKARKEGRKVAYVPVIVGTDGAKSLLYTRLSVTKPGPGYCHFPVEREDGTYDERWFEGLTAERIRTTYKDKKPKREWVKIRERNEQLDCRVYANAALRCASRLWTSLQIGHAKPTAAKRVRRVRSRGIRERDR